MRICSMLFIFTILFVGKLSTFAQQNVNKNEQKEIQRIDFLTNLSQKLKETYNIQEISWDSTLNFLKQNEVTDSSEIFFVLGNLNSNNREYLNSIKYFLWAFESQKPSKNQHFKAEIIFCLAESYRKMVYSEKAIFYFNLLIEQYKAYLSNQRENKIYMEIGNSYYDLGKLEIAKKYYEIAYRNATINHDEINKVIALINIGNFYIVMKNYPVADSITNEALRISHLNGFDRLVVMCRFNLGETAFCTNNFASAETNFEYVLKYARNVKLGRLIPSVYKHYTQINYKQGDYEKAIFCSKLFHETRANYVVRDNQLKAFKEVNKVLIELKNYPAANELLMKNNELLDSLLFKEITEKRILTESLHQLVELESNYKSLENENIIKNEELLRFQIITLLVVIMLVLIASFLFLLFRSKNRIKKQSEIIQNQYDAIKKKNAETEELNHEIMMQSEEIMVQNEKLTEEQNKLERKIEERTRDLSQALQKAQESDKLKTSFLQNISHEIRTPLNAISGFSQLMISNKGAKEYYAEIINQNVYDLVDIVDNIMVLSKLQSNQYILSVSRLPVSRVIQLINKELHSIGKKYKTKNIEFRFENQASNEILLKTDVSLLNKALVQLIENAYKFTEKGEIVLKVENNETTVNFSVIDTGIGIREDKIPYIFDTFRKIEGEEKIFRGTGIGLALVKKIMEMFNGKIKIDSIVGKGTNISIEMEMNSNLESEPKNSVL